MDAQNNQNQINLSEQEMNALVERVHDRVKADEKGTEILTRQQMYDKLAALPAETERSYETTLVGYSVDWDESILTKELTELMALANETNDPKSEQAKVAFAAFGVAVNHQRRMKNPTAERELLNEKEAVFGKHIFFYHMDLLNRMGNVDSIKRAEELESLLLLARKNAANLTGNVGGHHAFTETVVLAYEKKADLMRVLDKKGVVEADGEKPINWLEEATVSIKVATTIDNYPKFHCTYGRLLALKGEFDEAMAEINIAIDKENNQRADYAIRIGQYLNYYQQAVANKQMADMEAAFEEKMQTYNAGLQAYEDEVQNKMLQYETQAAETMAEYKHALEDQEKQTIVKNMEFLGLFSGIVSFTIGSLTISGAIAEQSIKHAAGLIIVLMGALMGVFAAFGVILHGIEKKTALRNVVVLVMGLVTILGGILFCLS